MITRHTHHSYCLCLFFYLFSSIHLQAYNTNNAALEDWVNDIFNQITTAAGDFQRTLPTLVLTETQTNVAKYKKSANQIIVEQKAIRVCQQFGKEASSALAFLLAHELTHFYQQHDWKESGFSTSFIQHQDVYQSHIDDEHQADTYGAFLAHLAGYETLKLIPNLFEAIYEAYQLSDAKLYAYPRLEERKTAATTVCKQLEELITIYETAHYSIAIGQYEDALSSYQYVLNFIKCKELYANIGLTYALIANQYKNEYAYPFAIAGDLPLRDGGFISFESAITNASMYLNQAVTYDPSYHQGFINLASVYLLDNNLSSANTLIQQLQAIRKSNLHCAQLAILKGILSCKKNDCLTGKKIFSDLLDAQNSTSIRWLALHNINYLAGKNTSKPKQAIRKERNNIDNYSLLYPETLTEKSIDLTQELRLGIKYTPNARMTVFEKEQEAISGLILTSSIKLSTQSDIKVNQSIELLKKRYGTPERLYQLGDNYSLWVYPQQKLVFKVQDKYIAAWGIYGIW